MEEWSRLGVCRFLQGQAQKREPVCMSGAGEVQEAEAEGLTSQESGLPFSFSYCIVHIHKSNACSL